MYKKIMNIMFLFATFNSLAISKNLDDKNMPEVIGNTIYYKTVAISSIKGVNESGALEYKILLLQNKPATGKIIWEISTNLPLTETQCDVAYADPCDKGLNELYKGSCFKPCISYGPEFLDFDEKNGKLYFTAASASIGTGGGPYFIFVADINKKEIKFLKSEHGPLKGTLSPLGTYLLLKGMNSITVYNTITGKESIISETNNWNKDHERLHYISDIIWLNDTTFSYKDGVRHSKFQTSFDEMKKNIYDINSKSVVQSKILSKHEFNSAL
jgi:hypothetical protein